MQYMPKEPDKYDIKFWLAVVIETKHILNAISCLGKEETRAPLHRLSGCVVINFMEP